MAATLRVSNSRSLLVAISVFNLVIHPEPVSLRKKRERKYIEMTRKKKVGSKIEKKLK